MTQKTYSIFGAGAAGLYTAWRLLEGQQKNAKSASRQLKRGDVLELYDWGQYDFNAAHPGTRAAGARICTWHYQNNPDSSFVELGGMRYSHWESTPTKAFPDPNGGTTPGHRLVTTVIHELGLDPFSVPFNVTINQLYSLRTRNFYLNDITSNHPAPYAAANYAAGVSPDNGFAVLQNLVPQTLGSQWSRKDWCHFYTTGVIERRQSDASVFQQGDRLRDIGYWNLLYDQLGSEGFDYASDGNGYSSNVINTHAGVSMNINNEFTPGTQYRTLTTGFSGMFNALFDRIVKLAKAKGVVFNYRPDTRLHSILWKDGKAAFTLATRANPDKPSARGQADAAWLAMGRGPIDQVAQATRYQDQPGLDVLNHEQVTLYREATIMQPSYKVGMFFDTDWYSDLSANPPAYPARIEGYCVTQAEIAELAQRKFPAPALKVLETLAFTPYAAIGDLVAAIEAKTGTALTIRQMQDLQAVAANNTIGPSVTDSPIRMVVYFGNNATNGKGKPVYGILASYDDEDNAGFWRQLELQPNTDRKVPASRDTQPLDGPRTVPPAMVKMLRKLLATVHFGPSADYSSVPEPLEATYMDWSLPPFHAGYHEWAPHYDIADVQRKIRKPSQLIAGQDAEIFIVGEAYSNDQAWVEGAYCVAESVLNDFFGIRPLIDDREYPFICPA
ncbi:hypothetical protein [Acidovorax sp. NCPPB 4044]|uniref:hypothetical protein n=1 Tax=Acidovorax sp. NCPPB 4044 TaxID=2940490 RepID=UPI002302EA6C|nr:hypothetical protein [Acidovorax sp. NCPPB 4044]MDA8519758.1 hypothetical protein [Acidovorax sp. NCPPB 4044]